MKIFAIERDFFQVDRCEGCQPNGTRFRFDLFNSGSPLPINSDDNTVQPNQAHSEFLGRGVGGEGKTSCKNTCLILPA